MKKPKKKAPKAKVIVRKTVRRAKPRERHQKPSAPTALTEAMTPRKAMKVHYDAVARSMSPRDRRARDDLTRAVFKMAIPPPNVVPRGFKLAMDEVGVANNAWAMQGLFASAFKNGYTFLGYPFLAELAQVPEYRRGVEVIATEMTRKWIKITSVKAEDEKNKRTDEQKASEKGRLEAEREDKQAQLAALQNGGAKNDNAGNGGVGNDTAPPQQSEKQPSQSEKQFTNAGPETPEKGEEPEGLEAELDGDDPDEEQDPEDAEAEAEYNEQEEKIKELEAEFERLKVQEVFREIAECDGFFGRAHLYLDTGATDMREELMTPLGSGQPDDEITAIKFKQGSLERLVRVEPVWCYPANYNASDPLKPDWYNPGQWFVMGKELHVSRLLPFVGREVPDMLKPAYSFGGLSLTQMAKPYVDNWLETRSSVNAIIQAFSVMVLKTNMSTSLEAGGEEVLKRADFFNNTRDNRGVFLVDKDTEDFANVSAPITGLDSLQAQAQEHMCSVFGEPLVKFTGITPQGLNASSDGEIRVFYDAVHAFQEKFFRPNLTKVFHFAQLNIWGQIDPDLKFDFEPLWSLDEKSLAEMRKVEAETDATLIDAGVIHPEESRARVATDSDSPYSSIDVNDVPEQMMPEPGNIEEKLTGQEDGGGQMGGGGTAPGGPGAVEPGSGGSEK